MGKQRPRLLTVAGSDSGGGAGIQADLKTFAAFGAYGMSVVTAVTAQNTLAVTAVHEIPPDVVRAQIDAVFEDLGVDAVKIGMLSSSAIIRQVAERLAAYSGPPIVLDPVMVAKSGAPLLAETAVRALRQELLPLATVVTPNLPELERLVGSPVGSEAERRSAAGVLARLGPAVLVKGGHGEGPELVDLLFDGEREHRFTHLRRKTRSTHGTGCTLSSAIAVGLARGRRLEQAVEEAIDYLQGAIAGAHPLGAGHGPVDHLYRLGGTDG